MFWLRNISACIYWHARSSSYTYVFFMSILLLIWKYIQYNFPTMGQQQPSLCMLITWWLRPDWKCNQPASWDIVFLTNLSCFAIHINCISLSSYISYIIYATRIVYKKNQTNLKPSRMSLTSLSGSRCCRCCCWNSSFIFVEKKLNV